MKLINIENSKLKQLGDFDIKAYFDNSNRINRLDVIKKEVPFKLNNKQLKENAVLRFKNNHKQGEIYTVETIFANIHLDKIHCFSGYKTIQLTKWDKPYKERKNQTLKTIWENPYNNRHIANFIKLFGNFDYFLNSDIIFFENAASANLKQYAKDIIYVYANRNKGGKDIKIPYIPNIITGGLLTDDLGDVHVR